MPHVAVNHRWADKGPTLRPGRHNLCQERWDGRGYPDRLEGEEIPLLARIVRIADTWDAMTGDRVYRKGMSQEKALSLFVKERDRGQWDLRLVDLFIKMIQSQNHEW